MTSARVETRDPTGGDGAARWLRPDRFPAALLPGTHQSLDLIQKRGAAESRLRIELTTVGIGWLHLPDGPQEVVLQRALIDEEPVAGGGTSRLLHQWVNPRLGIVASIGGPARGRLDYPHHHEKGTAGFTGFRFVFIRQT